MVRVGRSALVALLALATAMVIVFPSTIPSALVLTATALYMGGTGHPLTVPEETPEYIASYVQWAYNDFVGPSGLCTGGDPGCAQIAVFGPQQFWPLQGLSALTFDESVVIGLGNLDNCLHGVACTVTPDPFTVTGSQVLTDTSYTVFSYSQSGTIASIQKSYLIAHPPAGTVSFVFESNPNRPNGGILERFVGAYIPILDVTFNGATVTNSPQPAPLTTVDVVHQYDPVADFPTNPLNLIADLNALLGFAYEHPEEGHGTAVLQGQYQDSTYYLVPTLDGELPLVRPLKLIPIIGPLLATVLDPVLRVLVETGYDRTINPGAPTPAKWLYFPNPIATAVNLMGAVPTGLDNGIAYLTGDPTNRPFHTTPQGPYGVGGPPVDAGAIDPYGPPTPVASAAPAVSAAATAKKPAAAATTKPATPTRRATPRPAATVAHGDPDGQAASRTVRPRKPSTRSAN